MTRWQGIRRSGLEHRGRHVRQAGCVARVHIATNCLSFQRKTGLLGAALDMTSKLDIAMIAGLCIGLILPEIAISDTCPELRLLRE